jgi:nitrite reductase/ring-hydroxylating ferredoxin subunit
MLSKLFGLFRGVPARVEGTDGLPEGHATTIALGDPLAGGTEVVLCRVEGKLYALDRVCPHEGGRLSGGPLVAGRLAVCPLHNYRFDATNGKAVGAACRSAKIYRVREQGSDAVIWV